MNCLSCNSALDHANHEGIEIDICAACGGTWVDRSELHKLTASEADATSLAEQQAELAARGGIDKLMSEVRDAVDRACPKCSESMKKQLYAEYSSVVLDVCVTCGIWLDGGELRRVEAFAEGTRAQLVRGVASSGA